MPTVYCHGYERVLNHALMERCFNSATFPLERPQDAPETEVFAIWKRAILLIMPAHEQPRFLALSETEQRTYFKEGGLFGYGAFLGRYYVQFCRRRQQTVH